MPFKFLKTTMQKAKYLGEYLVFRAIMLFVRMCGIGVFRIILLLLFFLFGFVLYPKLKKRLRLARYNLSLIDANAEFKTMRFIRSFVRFLEAFAEITVYKQNVFKKPKFNLVMHGGEVLQRLKDEGRGCIIVSFHYGNWELAPMYFQKTFGMTNYFIYKEQKNKLIDNSIKNARMGLPNVLPLKKGAKDIASIPNITKAGGSVCVLIDQKQHFGSEPVSLFGKQVKIGFTIQKIAIKHNIPIVPVFCFLDRGGDKTRYSMYIHEPILASEPVTKDNLTTLTQQATQQIADIASKHIKHDPYQWFCLIHRLFGNPPQNFK